MITLKGDTSLVGISEFRTKAEEIFKEMQHRLVVVGKRNRPFAVLLPIDKYERMEQMLEALEDTVLGHLAKERFEASKHSDFVSADAVFGAGKKRSSQS